MAVSVDKEVRTSEAQEGAEVGEGRGLEYTQYEANAWACTFLKSGEGRCWSVLNGSLSAFSGQAVALTAA